MYFTKEKFMDDLQSGKRVEKMILDVIVAYYGDGVKLITTIDDTYCDFVLSNNLMYKVIYDGKSYKTGNIYIEYSAYGKDSGITTTQAHYYIIVIPKYETEILIDCNFTFALISVERIKDLINMGFYKNHINIFLNGGYVFDKKVILDNCILL